MTSRLSVALCIAAVALPFISEPASAQAQTQASGYKIGVVDMQTLIEDYPKLKQSLQQLQQEVDRRQVAIDAMSRSIEQQKATYEQRQAQMTEQQRLDMKNQIEDEYEKYRLALEREQRHIDNEEEKLFREALGDIEQAIARVAQEENYHLILNSSRGGRGSVVLWSSPTIDITAKVQAVLNRR